MINFYRQDQTAALKDADHICLSNSKASKYSSFAVLLFQRVKKRLKSNNVFNCHQIVFLNFKYQMC